MMLNGLEILRLCEVLPTLIKSFHHRNILTKYIIELFYYNYVQCISGTFHKCFDFITRIVCIIMRTDI